MAIAIIPFNEDPKESRKNWLSMGQADDLFCEYLGIKPDPSRYHRGWFSAFYVFDWYSTKNQSKDNYSVVFETAEKNGEISSAESKKIAKWALIQIYKIQNNSKLLNAIKTYDILK